MYKIIAIIGQAGSGKDAALWSLKKDKKLCDKINFVINCTTRPKRDNEKAIQSYDEEGPGYKFLQPSDLWSKLTEDQLIELTSFNNWVYGTELQALDENKVNVGVFNPNSLDMMLDNPNLDIKVVLIHAEPKTRLIRQLERETWPDIDEIFRRYQADKKMFDKLDMKKIYIYINETEKQLNSFKRFIAERIADWDEKN